MPVIIYEVYSYLVIGSWFLAVFSERKLPIRIILAVPKSAKLSIIVRNILVDVFLVHKSAAVNVLSPSFGWCALKMHFLCTLEGINFFPFSSIIGHIFPRIKFFYESSFGLQLAAAGRCCQKAVVKWGTLLDGIIKEENQPEKRQREILVDVYDPFYVNQRAVRSTLCCISLRSLACL